MVASPNYVTLRQKKIALREMFLSTSFRCALLTTVVAFSVLYLFQTNSLSTKGYVISDLKRQVQTLEHESQKLEFEIATYRSMKSIEQRLQGMNFIVADDAEYATVFGSTVARR